MFERLRERLFTTFWRSQAPIADDILRDLKTRLFGNVRGRVLELGPGTGVNFRYFPPHIEWIGIEPNERLREILRTHPSKPSETMLLNRIEDMNSGSVDTVVSSLVLCSVPHLDSTLQEIRRVLRPGGTLLCIEHVAAPKGTVYRFGQKLIKPLSRRFGGGCEPDRDIADAIRRALFATWEIEEHSVAFTRLPWKVPIISCTAVR